MDAVELRPSDGQAYYAAVKHLADIKRLGEQLRGENMRKQLYFFSTEEEVIASNDFGNVILSAILSDCETCA